MDALQELFLMQQSWMTLFCVTNKLQAVGDQYSKQLKNITIRQIMVMIAIIHLNKCETSLNNIARKLGTTKQSVRHLVTAMENKKYVTITPNQDDKRAVNVQLTSEGRDILHSYCELSVEYFTKIFREFSAEEVNTLWDLLKKLYRFDGKEQEGFEEYIRYDEENEFSDYLQEQIQKFEIKRSMKLPTLPHEKR